MVKYLLATQETWVRSLEKGMATHSSILVWRIPMDRGVWWAIVHGVARDAHDLAIKPPPGSYIFKYSVSESEVAQLCLTLSNFMDCSPPGSSIHGIFQARVLEEKAAAAAAVAKSLQSCPPLCNPIDGSP